MGTSEFLGAVEDYLARTGTAPSRFGAEALGDRGFVAGLRRGRSCTTRVVERVVAFMRANPGGVPPGGAVRGGGDRP